VGNGPGNDRRRFGVGGSLNGREQLAGESAVGMDLTRIVWVSLILWISASYPRPRAAVSGSDPFPTRRR
jgi:hypothetical protein